MSLTKAEFVGTHVIDTPEKRDFILASANNRGQEAFNAMAPLGTGGRDLPLSLEDMLDTYILDDAGVEKVLNDVAIRGHEFLSAVVIAALEPVGIIDVAAGTVAEPAQITFEGLFPAGSTVTITTTTDVDGEVVVVVPVIDTVGHAEMGKIVAAYIGNDVPELGAEDRGDGVVWVTPYPANTTVTINTVVVGAGTRLEPTVRALGGNRFQFTGIFPDTTAIDWSIHIIDPDDDEDMHTGTHVVFEDTPAGVVAEDVCGAIEELPHVRCEKKPGGLFHITPAAEGYIVTAEMHIAE